MRVLELIHHLKHVGLPHNHAESYVFCVGIFLKI
jgi:hypothetical protein